MARIPPTQAVSSVAVEKSEEEPENDYEEPEEPEQEEIE